ncbi:MAG: HAMP domain-containing histidine kinase [Lachnospiraceae bacterium]|nr:HAMP domain-containing histidine kinase [Lachnospiraceae bacterium]
MFENKTIARIEEMLDAAIEGTFVESDYEETRLSRLESRWKEFLGSSVLSNQNLEAERHRLEQFISDISHQTKTPMTNIRMYTELLKEEAARGENASIEKISSFAAMIDKQNARLEFLIDALTKLSRLENGTLTVKAQEGPVDKLIETSVSAVESKAKLKNISISHKKNEALKASFDLKWTNEALINILDNAVKYSPENGRIEVFAEQFEMYQAIHVIDNGPGISEEETAKIFGRFYRGSEVQQEEGVGIGLYLTREIIAKEDGYIKVVPNNKREGGELIVYLRR